MVVACKSCGNGPHDHRKCGFCAEFVCGANLFRSEVKVFCGKVCRDAFQVRVTLVQTTSECAFCGELFVPVSGVRRGLYCSEICARLYQRELEIEASMGRKARDNP